MTREESINIMKVIVHMIEEKYDTDRVEDAVDMAIKALEQEQKWIPVSERLPKDGKWALFTDGSNMSVERYKKDAIDHFFPQERWFSFDKAIAWMPLPEPYKAESASEKEKLKAEVNGYFYGLNAAGKIDWLTYNTLYNVCMSILEKYYDRMEKERKAESEEKRMKKVFISQPMNGLSDLQILEERRRAVEKLYDMGYEPKEITIIDSFIKDTAPDNVNSELWCLGRSLELLADADIAVFSKGWKNTRGCLIEFDCANKYGISYICED